ncbi:MAG: anti-sigma factor domain-containing protein [Clostridiales bacterium]|nr:anti-sigma factor domain-containing protein [Clostridiales bacterium]
MRGIVVETKENNLIVLSEDGGFVQIAGTAAVGQSIELPAQGHGSAAAARKLAKGRRTYRHAFVAAAVALLLLFGGTWDYMTVQACTRVTLGTDTYVEYTLNRMDKVIGVKAGGENAEEVQAVLDESGLDQMTLTEAASVTVDMMNTYAFWEEDAPIDVSVESRDGQKQQQCEEEIEKVLHKESPKTQNAGETFLTEDPAAGQAPGKETEQQGTRDSQDMSGTQNPAPKTVQPDPAEKGAAPMEPTQKNTAPEKGGDRQQ